MPDTGSLFMWDLNNFLNIDIVSRFKFMIVKYSKVVVQQHKKFEQCNIILSVVRQVKLFIGRP